VRVLIVGGAGVFGRRLAESLNATTDATIIIAGRTPERLEQTAESLGVVRSSSDRSDQRDRSRHPRDSVRIW
jgi:short-subunit dehydrogenase involved in D-alanine esterification of teichoic acids